MTRRETTCCVAVLMVGSAIMTAWKFYGKASTKDDRYRRTRRGGKNYIEKVQCRPR